MGIEPTAQAWEAWVLPLYDARDGPDSNRVPRGGQIMAAALRLAFPPRQRLKRKTTACKDSKTSNTGHQHW